MKNIHVLPTDKPSRLVKQKYDTLDRLCLADIATKRAEYKRFNIYITSDEEIKEGDWFYSVRELIEKAVINYPKGEHFGKIILTTDQDLIKDGVQSIDDEFLEWFVKNSSCEEIEIDKINLCTQTGLPCGMQCLSKETCNKNISYKIIIPKEEQDKKMYSEEEFLAFGKSCFYKGFEKAENDDANCYTAFREEIGNLFEQFKNR